MIFFCLTGVGCVVRAMLVELTALSVVISALTSNRNKTVKTVKIIPEKEISSNHPE